MRWLIAALLLATPAWAVSDEPSPTSSMARASVDLSPGKLVETRQQQLARCSNTPLALAACQIALGEALLVDRAYAEAETVLRAANATLAATPSPAAKELRAQGQSALGEALAWTSKYKEGEAELRAALAVLINPADRAIANVRLAHLLGFAGRTTEAGAVLLEARQLAAAAGVAWSADHEARLLTTSAFQEALLERHADAQRNANAAIRLIEASYGTTDARLSLPLGILAASLNISDGPIQTEVVQERRLKVEQSRDRPNPMMLGSVLNDLANGYANTNRVALALPLRAQVVALTERSRPGPSRELAIRQFNYGKTYSVVGRYAEALPVLRQAYSTAVAVFGKDHPDTTIILVELGEALGQLGQHEESVPTLELAVRLREQGYGADHRLTLAARRMLGSALLAAGRPQPAVALLSKVVADTERLEGNDSADLVLARINLAEASVRSGDVAAARAQADAALRGLARSPLEDFMGLRRAPAKRGAALELYGQELTRLLLVQFQIGETDPTAVDAAFATLQRLDAERQGTASVWRAAERLSTNDAEVAGLVDLQRAAQSRISAARSRQAAAVRAGDTAAALAALEAIAREQRSLADLVQGLGKRLPAFAQLSGGVQTSLSAVTGGAAPALGQDEALVSFTQTRDVLLALVATRRGTAMVQLPGTSAASLTSQIKALRNSLNIGEAVTADALPVFDVAASQSLHDQIMRPLLPHLRGVNRLYVAVDGPLAGLPLALLVSRASAAPNPLVRYRQSRWLADQFTVVTLPSVNALVAYRAVARPSAASRPLLAFADPSLRGTARANTAAAFAQLRGGSIGTGLVQRTASALCQMQPLPDTRREAMALAQRLGSEPGAVLLGAEASEASLRARQANGSLRSYRTLLFATHGLLAGSDASEEPALVLSPPPECTATSDSDDGLLTTSEISLLALDADLVILSGCNTAGALEAVSARPLSGLASAFQYAGARRLLVSHWSVDSAATADLMGNLFAGGQAVTPERLQTAMKVMRNSKGQLGYRAHPAFWAPFVLVGDAQ